MAENIAGKSLEVKNAVTMIEGIKQVAPELAKALPKHMDAKRLVRIGETLCRQNPDLYQCSLTSMLGALFTAAQIGLEPIAGRSYILPFNNKKKIGGKEVWIKEAQFVIGYRGIVELFYRHGKSIALRWGVVKENDFFEYEKGTEEFLKHKETPGNRGKTSGFWVMAQLEGGGRPFEYMTYEDCMEHAKRHSKSYDKKEKKFFGNSPWITEPESMCLKTVLLQLSKLLPLSVEIQRALEADESTREIEAGSPTNKEVDSVIDIPSSTNWDIEDTTAEVMEPEKKEPVKTKVDFPDEAPQSPPINEVPMIEKLEHSLEAVKHEGTKEAYELWWSRNEADIKTMQQKDRNSIRSAWLLAKKEAK